MSEEAYRLFSTAARNATTPHVLPSPRHPGRHLNDGEYYNGWGHTLKAAGVAHVGTHGIRHRSDPGEGRYGADGAQERGDLMRYVHTEDKPVREAAELVASRRKAITGAKQRPAEVSA